MLLMPRGQAGEVLSPETKLRAALDIINYGHAKVQAVQLSNPDGSLRPVWEIHFVGEQTHEKGTKQ